jgi:hypothetical protein
MYISLYYESLKKLKSYSSQLIITYYNYINIFTGRQVMQVKTSLPEYDMIPQNFITKDELNPYKSKFVDSQIFN